MNQPENSRIYNHLSLMGRAMAEELDELAKEYKYRPFDPVPSQRQREHYHQSLPRFWKNFRGQEVKLLTHNNVIIANGVTARGLVIGDYGAFLEIPDELIVKANIEVPESQAYRFLPKYNVKYYWYTDKGGSGIKLYQQRSCVSYADYRPGMWYVSPYEVQVAEKQYDSYTVIPEDCPSVRSQDFYHTVNYEQSTLGDFGIEL